MASSLPASPPSVSNSENSATNPISLTQPTQIDIATNNGVSEIEEKKPDIVSDSMDSDGAEDTDKYMKYEADYARRLMAKYFSKKDLNGDNIFDEKVTIDGEIIRSSRWPATRTYADPVQGFENQNHQSSTGSTSTEETSTDISNGKHTLKMSG